MTIQDYIQSGIIESYVLGLADAEEVALVEQLRATHPEMDEAIIAFEKEMEETAITNAMPVPGHLKQDIFRTLNLQPEKTTDATPLQEGAPVVAMRNHRFLKFMAAASVLLFVASALLNLYTYTRYKKLLVEHRQLALERGSLYAKNEAMQTRMNELDKSMQAITGADMVKVNLAGMPGKENNHAIVYWSKTTKEVYLQAKNLPAAPAGMQYQLWALVDGKPVDAGMLSDCVAVCKLKSIQTAQAFAITLEKQGGSPTPNLEQLYVMGKI